MIGIIGALDVEVAGFIALMTDATTETISRITYTKGKIKGKDCVVAQCGIGKVNAAMCAQTMILTYNPSHLINSGVAGALAKDISIGDIVISTDVVQHDIKLIGEKGEDAGFDLVRGTVEFSDEKIIRLPADQQLAAHLKKACSELDRVTTFLGTIATGEQFISSIDARLEIGTYFNALACEMEGGAIGQVCYRNGVPFVILRAISDNIDANSVIDFMAFKTLAANNTTKAIARMFDLL